METGSLIAEPVAVSAIRKMQPFQAKRKGLILSRLFAMAMVGRKRPRYYNLKLGENAKKLGLKQNLRSFAGTLRRLIKPK